MSYAENTSVSVSKSRIEIEELLKKWKATRTATAVEAHRAIVMFQIGKWMVRFTMPLPTEEEAKKQKTSRGWLFSTEQRAKWMEQQERSRWRALLLTIKAKLVSVESGVETFEVAFMAHLVLPGNVTVGEKALPAINEAYETGHLPPLLGAGGGQ